jgi:murein DD-endopeptidase MepM/ murein hydrolase activator NlpD
VRLAVVPALALLAPLPVAMPPPPSSPMAPVLEDGPRILRRDMVVSAGADDLRWVRGVRDLAENRFDLETLPPDTPLSVWTVDEKIIAFSVAHAYDEGETFAAQIDTGTSRRWVFHDGTSLEGPMRARLLDYRAVTSKIGLREHPVRKRVRFHSGTDYAAPIGTPVLAFADGVVRKSARNWSAGKYIVLKHDDGHETRYLHLAHQAAGIKEGARVRQGQVIGAVGKTGRVTGPHLHFEIRDRWHTPIDPIAMRWPARLHVDDARALAALHLRRELLLSFDVTGRPALDHPLTAPAARLAGHRAPVDDAGVALPPLAAIRTSEVRARLTPPLRRRLKRPRRGRAAAADSPVGLFDDVQAALADPLLHRAVQLSLDFENGDASARFSGLGDFA